MGNAINLIKPKISKMKKLRFKLETLGTAEVLTRDQLKNVLRASVGGTGGGGSTCGQGTRCSYYESGTGMVTGWCDSNSAGSCVCDATTSSVVWSACYTEG